MQAGRKRTGRTIEVYDLLPPEPAARREPIGVNRPVLVEDAVFEVVPVRRPREHNDNPARRAETVRFEPARYAAIAGVYIVNRLERLLSGLSTQSFSTLIASLFLIMFWLCGGFSALGGQPVAGPRPSIVIDKVFTEAIDQNGMRLLAVGGVLMNHADTARPVPPLSVVGEGGEVIGTIAPPTRELAAGQSVRFFGRFQRPGGKSSAVTIFPVTR